MAALRYRLIEGSADGFGVPRVVTASRAAFLHGPHVSLLTAALLVATTAALLLPARPA